MEWIMKPWIGNTIGPMAAFHIIVQTENKWNKIIAEAGIDFELSLPHRAFHRGIGTFSTIKVDPQGNIITAAEWDKRQDDWLPSDADRVYVTSLMKAVTEPGKVAAWIAPPAKGINGQPADFEYVRFN